MKLEKFEEILNILIEQSEVSNSLYKLGVDLLTYSDPLYRVIDMLFDTIYNKEQMEWIYWYLYEKPANGTARDAEGNLICQNVKELYEYLETVK